MSVVVAFIALTCLGLNLAQAQSSITFDVRNSVVLGVTQPGFVVTAAVRVKTLTITLKPEKGKTITVKKNDLPAQTPTDVTFAVPRGVTKYHVAVQASFEDNTRYETESDMTFTALPPIEVKVDKRDVNLDTGEITFTANHQPAKAQLEIVGANGDVLYSNEQQFTADARLKQTLSWPATKGEKLRVLRITVYDAAGSYSGYEFLPFEVSIPHDELVFDTGKDDVRPDQLPKIKDTYARIQDEMKNYGPDLALRLYVAGYTDTVGSKESNLELSERRARSIGNAFSGLGLKIPIYYQGFGEEALAVATPDETPEERNRRAMYILSDHTPALTTGGVPGTWKQLR
jgi:outer membrane protein OmpA-like peptidoglycan-associated protein